MELLFFSEHCALLGGDDTRWAGASEAVLMASVCPAGQKAKDLSFN